MQRRHVTHAPLRKENTLEKDFINIQSTDEFRTLRFGILGNVANNGCGGIAARNMLLANGVDLSLNEVIKGLRLRLGTAFGLGLLGTNFFSLFAYMSKFLRMRLSLVIGLRRKVFSSCTAVIILYYWKHCKKLGAHFITGVRCDDGKFDFYNYRYSKYHASIDELYAAFKKESSIPIGIIGSLGKRGK